MDPFLAFAIRALQEEHRCHTVVLYGSRARGEENPESDYDLLAFRDDGPKISDCREVNGRYLDAHIYPAKDLDGREKEFRQLHHGQVLLDHEGVGARLLARINEIMAGPPEPVAADQLQLRRVWYEKTLRRIERGDPEGNYRRAMLLMNATEDYFDFRNLWVLGPRLSFKWLRENAPDSYATFETALKPGASAAELRALVDAVVIVDR